MNPFYNRSLLISINGAIAEAAAAANMDHKYLRGKLREIAVRGIISPWLTNTFRTGSGKGNRLRRATFWRDWYSNFREWYDSPAGLFEWRFWALPLRILFGNHRDQISVKRHWIENDAQFLCDIVGNELPIWTIEWTRNWNRCSRHHRTCSMSICVWLRS